jgi:hypothetical protein
MRLLLGLFADFRPRMNNVAKPGPAAGVIFRETLQTSHAIAEFMSGRVVEQAATCEIGSKKQKRQANACCEQK